MVYLPEGKLLQTAQNKMALSSFDNLKQAMENKTIIEAKAILCDSSHNLIVDLNGIKGIIPKNEGAVGIAEGTTRDIALISRVNKPVCFVIESLDKDQNGEVFATLSRKKAQMMCNENYIKKLKCGDVIDAVVTHMEPFGCFGDILRGRRGQTAPLRGRSSLQAKGIRTALQSRWRGGILPFPHFLAR